MVNLYQLIADLRAQHAQLSADGVLTWREAVQLIVHAFRQVAGLIADVSRLERYARKELLRKAAAELFDQIVAPILRTKLESRWYLKLVSRFAIPMVRDFWMSTAENAIDAMANIIAVERSRPQSDGILVGVSAREVRYGSSR